MKKLHKLLGCTINAAVTMLALAAIFQFYLRDQLLCGDLDLAKQKKTISDLRHLGMAWQARVNASGGSVALPEQDQKYATTGHVELSYAELFVYLRPSDTSFYMDHVPDRDG